MPVAKISMPFILRERGSNEPCSQKDSIPEVASAVWKAGALCFTSGTGAATVLNPCATAATLVYGQSPDAAKFGGNTRPPDALFGLNHFCFAVLDRVLEVNAASQTAGVGALGTANGVTYLGGGTNGVALAPGQRYGLWVAPSGPFAGIQFLDVNNVTLAQQLFEIVAIAPNQSTADNNPRIEVRVVVDKIQG